MVTSPSRNFRDRVLSLHPPNANGAVTSAGAEQRAVAIKGDGVHGRVVPQVGRQQVARLLIPDFDGAVRAAGGNLVAVGCKGDGPDIAFVAFPTAHQLTGPHVPETHRSVP